MANDATQPLQIGVLALQGSFREHIKCLNQLAGVQGVEIRRKEELEGCVGLIIPGGESTTMALVAEQWGLIPEMQAFAGAGKPIWGTCAGLIFLANRASGQKKGGQALLGGLDCYVQRNFFGAQINSFEMALPVPACLPEAEKGPFRAIFIRAPAVLETGPDVEVLAEYELSAEERAAGLAEQHSKVAVAVRSKQLLATAFHPELTADLRWHKLFADMVRQHATGPAAAAGGGGAAADAGLKHTLPNDLPVFDRDIVSR